MQSQATTNADAMRERLKGLSGKRYWRSLDELAGSPSFQELLEREFPAAASEWHDGASRRQFLSLMAASLALAGLTGCTRRPGEKILPYVRQPEQIVPGKPLLFATAMPLNGYGSGVLVESHMGRPTKIEGNPEHPASLGSTSALTQASILSLYDPDRSQTVSYRGQIRTWDMFLTALRPKLERLAAAGGEGLRILTGTVTSPTVAARLRAMLQQFPGARWHQYDPSGAAHEHAGLGLLFGRDVSVVYDFSAASTILSLDADFLGNGPGHVRYARDFATRRGMRGGGQPANRFYALECTPTITGAQADHRLPLLPSQLERAAQHIAARVGVPGVSEPDGDTGLPAAWLDAVAEDLQSYRDRFAEAASLVIAGPWQSPRVHTLAQAMNVHLAASGRTVHYVEPIEANRDGTTGSLEALADAMRDGEVDTLVILDANPVYDAPADLEFGEAMGSVSLRIHMGMFEDETSLASDWHLPATHYLESWGDIRAYDGTVTIQQPLIAPLYAGRSSTQLLAALAGEAGKSSRDLVKEHWQAAAPGPDFEDRWETWIHDGLVSGTEAEPVEVTLPPQWIDRLGPLPEAGPSDTYTMLLRPDPTVLDGQFANNGWLQELPKPFSKLTWDNAALVSPATAERLGVESGDVVELQADGRTIRLPVWPLPGQPDDAVTVHLGYGRERVGRVGDGLGASAYKLQRFADPWKRQVEIARTSETRLMASTQNHFLLDGRDLIRAGTVDEYRSDPRHLSFMESHHPGGDASLLPEYDYSDGYKWGMVIDLTRCTGCNACVVACQSENNIPIVGKEEVARGREMHWIRIDTYYEGDSDNPDVHFQPLPCMHCEKAPCEIVCPVAATTHSPGGINEMTYNRCVGTRYCANNCPYKVRRFNYLHYNEPVEEQPILQMLQNPDVTVRARGVMEKCTYCVQRVNAARIEAEKEDRSIRDGEMVTACQGACPSRAIEFGDLNDGSAAVTEAHRSPLRYGLLEELNTQPRTTYLAELRNPHPRLAELDSHGE